MEKVQKTKWINSIKRKQMLMLLIIILFLTFCSFCFFYATKKVAVNAIYDQMKSQAEYYLESVEHQITGIIQQQTEMFSDRKLSFLADRDLLSNAYERREALLSVQERLFALKSSNNLIESATIYIPGSDYKINSSTIREMMEEDFEKNNRLKNETGKLIPDGNSLSYTLTEIPYSVDRESNFYFQIILDQNKLVDHLNNFVSSDGGACLYKMENEWFLEDTIGKGLGQQLVAELKEKKIKQTDGINEVVIEKEHYLVSISYSEYLGFFIQYSSKDRILAQLHMYTKWFVLFIVCSVFMVILFSRYTEKMVNKPLKELCKAFDILRKGTMNIRISHSANDEFGYIYENFNHMTCELEKLINEVYVQKDLVQKAELKQLQTQINPHFLYNSFFLLSRRAKRNDMEGTVELSEYLGTYFKYLTRNAADTLYLKKEIEHGECYAKIQATRFASRMKVVLEELPEAVREVMVPRLIIQPILENAFEYGLENKEENGLLKISYDMREDYIYILIENNGELTDCQLEELQWKLSEEYSGEVTGLINIHRRLKGYYKGKGGIGVSRGKSGGLLVCVCIPIKQK